MGKKKKRKSVVPEASRSASPEGGRVVWLALAAVIALAAFLRCWRLDAPLGGFHAFNEANYLLIARHFFTSSLLDPTPGGSYLFLETPPLYSYLLYAVFRIFGISILAARLVSVASSLALILATFLLGRRLFGPRPALAGALLIAVSPVSVLTGRNIQTDSTLLCFLVMGLLFWRRAETGDYRDRLLSGLFLGLALFTKLFALVGAFGMFVWDTLRGRGFAWLRDRWRWASALVAAALPLLFYGYHAARNFRHVRSDVFGGAAVATTLPLKAGDWTALGLESLWAFSPVVAVLVFAGAVRAAVRPSAGRLFLFIQLLAFLLFYLFVHKHSYYLLTLLPFGALLAGDLLESLSRAARIACLSAAAITGVFVSAVDITSMKLGFREFEDLSAVAAGLSPGHTDLVDESFRDNAGPVLAFCDPQARASVVEQLASDPDGRLLLPAADVYLLRFVPPQAAKPPVGWLFSRERFGLTLFGWTVAEAHPNPNFFRQGRYLAIRTGGPLDFGASVLRVYPALVLIPLPSDVALYRTAEGLAMRSR